MDKKKCFLKCKGMDPDKWKKQVEVFNNMMMIEYIQQAGWHLQCHPNTPTPIIQMREVPEHPIGPNINIGLVIQDKTLLDDHVRSECMGYQTEDCSRRNRVERGHSDGRGVAKKLPTYFNGYSYSGTLRIEGPSHSQLSPNCQKNFKNRARWHTCYCQPPALQPLTVTDPVTSCN